LTNINLTGLTGLFSIECGNNNVLDTLDLRNLTGLQSVICSDNYISTLLLNNTPGLRNLNCPKNRLTALDVSGSPNLLNFFCNENNIGTLSLSGLPQLQRLNCSGNILTTLNAIQASNLIAIDCSNNNLTTLNVTGLGNLTDLICNNNAITTLDLTGLSQLRVLRCFVNQLSVIDLNPVLQLTELSCANNLFPSLNLNMLTNLTSLNCGNTQLTSLNLSALTNLTSLSVISTQITGIDVSMLTNLTMLSISFNTLLSSLDVSNLVNLTSLGCLSNGLTSLDVSHNPLLEDLNCSENQITSLDVGNLVNLQRLNTYRNPIIALDVSNCPVLSQFNTQGCPNLAYLNLKNGSMYPIPYIDSCPNLLYACEDELYIQNTLVYLLNENPNIQVTSYCSFIPGGSYNTITGTVLYDLNANGCDASDLANPYLKVKIDDGTESGSTFTNAAGNYTFYSQQGNYTVSPVIENPAYFNMSPANAILNFPAVDSSTQTQNFCFSANGVHPDLEITFIPLTVARPGSDAFYRIVYKNKGNQSLSNLISLSFDESIIDFVSAVPNVVDHTTNQLVWAFNDLKPFETRTIDLTLHIHTPPVVDLGDILDFTATINPVPADESSEDNVFTLNQSIVNSLDPNRIVCLEGNTMALADVGKYLHYNIDFENIGSADAINVVVKDSINTAKFDLNSLQLQYASHNVETKIKGNIVEFIFKNIYLPGGPIGGHGNVLFKIRTLPNLVAGDDVVGIASIYFDYNAPVQTEEERTVIAGLGKNDFIKDASITVAPNPAKDFISISAKNTIKSIQLFDAQGRILQTVLDNKKSFTLDISNKTQGVYFLKVTTDKGSTIQKIIKE
jgi:Leucine-rich repeat (LRR) protein